MKTTESLRVDKRRGKVQAERRLSGMEARRRVAPVSNLQKKNNSPLKRAGKRRTVQLDATRRGGARKFTAAATSPSFLGGGRHHRSNYLLAEVSEPAARTITLKFQPSPDTGFQVCIRTQIPFKALLGLLHVKSPYVNACLSRARK